MFGAVCLLIGVHVTRLARKTMEGQTVLLVKGVMVSHRIAYFLAFYFYFTGMLFILVGAIVN
jgi:hypothetical protein